MLISINNNIVQRVQYFTKSIDIKFVIFSTLSLCTIFFVNSVVFFIVQRKIQSVFKKYR